MSNTARACLVLGSALSVLGAGCVDSEATLIIQCVAPSTVEVDEQTGAVTVTSGSCEEGGAGALFSASLAGQQPLFLTAFLRNQMSEDQRPSALRVGVRDVVLNQYEIAIDALGGTAGPLAVAGSGFVPAGIGPGQVGEVGVGFLAGTELTQVLDQPQTAVLRIRYFGRTTGGDDVETPWFYYPIIVAP